LLAVGAIAAVGIAVALGLNQTERGTGKRTNISPPAGLKTVALGQRSAGDFDPDGDKREHQGETNYVVDGDRASTWSTETYRSMDLQKKGVGLVIDTSSGGGVAGRQLEVRTPTPGFEATIYVSSAPRAPATAPPDGWTPVSATRASSPSRSRL